MTIDFIRIGSGVGDSSTNKRIGKCLIQFGKNASIGLAPSFYATAWPFCSCVLAYKFIQPNVTGVQVWTAHSLLLFWVDPLLGARGGSALIGVIEIVTGALIALRPVAPRLSMFGSLMAAFAMLNTLSFLFTTPGLDARGAGFGLRISYCWEQLFGQQPKRPPPIALGAQFVRMPNPIASVSPVQADSGWSFDFGAGKLDDLGPLVIFFGGAPAEVDGRHWHWHVAESSEPRIRAAGMA
ncbi:MAG: DUF417 family protein [Xanthobacteraceae bacterium]